MAVTIGDTKLSNAQLNYYYVDAAFEYANNYGMYASLFGLDLTKPLNEQPLSEGSDETWADEFVSAAISNAQATYALCAEAKANGFTISEDAVAEIENAISTFEIYASINGFANADEYVKAYYGRGASVKGFREYSEMKALAQEYYAHYANSLTYDDSALRAAEEGKEYEYDNYSYNYYYLNTSKFLTGGTTDEEGTTTYSDEEREAAIKAAEAVAKELAAGGYASVEELDAAIAQLEINAEAETASKSTACNDYAYSQLTAAAKDWLADASRKAGDLGYVENATTTTDEEGNETKTINGYYVLFFTGRSNNDYPLVNVRHILIAPEGGTYDSTTGKTTYTDAEKATANQKAKELLEQWLSGEATEDSFAALASEKTTDPGSKENGGLYEDVYPGQMVANFNDWCFDEARKVGDTGIVETNYGYHVMYYVGDSETNYRDFMLTNDLRNADTEEFYNQVVEAATVTDGDFSKIPMDLVLGGAQY